MADLIALDIASRQRLASAVEAAWEKGAAVMVLPASAPEGKKRQLVEWLAPTHVMDDSGEITRLEKGVPVLDGDALVVATSGTSADPKGVVLTMEAMRASVAATNEALRIAPEDCWVSVLPPNFIGGFMVIARAILTPTRIDFPPSLSELALMEGSSYLISVVAAQLPELDPDRFKAVLVGGGPSPNCSSPRVVRTYGLTETCSGVVYEGVPLPGVEIRVDPARGEIIIRSPTLLRAYRRRPGERAPSPEGFDPKDERGWFATGDVGAFTEDGRLTVLGRLDDAILSGGMKIWPERVEAVLRTHPAIGECAIVGVPDAKWGTKAVAFVVPRQGQPIPTRAELRSYFAEKLEPWELPHEFVGSAALPKTHTGKTDRARLRRLAQERAGSAAPHPRQDSNLRPAD
jgi:O-succinylbenzoic acid--CoA ligase